MAVLAHSWASTQQPLTPRLFDALSPFQDAHHDLPPAPTAERITAKNKWTTGDERASYTREPKRQRRTYYHEGGLLPKVEERNRRQQFHQQQRLLLRLLRAAPSQSPPGLDGHSEWSSAARLLTAPHALENSGRLAFRELTTRVGLEIVKSTQAGRRVLAFMQQLSQSYRSQMGLIALEKAFLLVSQTQWREAYECLENFLIMPGFREDSLFGAYCGILMFIIHSCGIAQGKAKEGENDHETQATIDQLEQARRHLDVARAKQDDITLLHFVVSIMINQDQTEEAVKMVQDFCKHHSSDPRGHSLMLDLSTKQCPADWCLRMQNAASQLDIDPISMNGLNSMLELCDGGYASLIDVIRRIAVQIEHIPEDLSLWKLLWATLSQLNDECIKINGEELRRFWSARCTWWEKHFFAPTSTIPPRLRETTLRHLLYRALCARMIYGDDLPFVADVRRLLRERSLTEDEILRSEDDELFLPRPCNLYSLLSAQEAPASAEDSYRALEDKNDALPGPTVATLPRELRLRCDTREQRARAAQELQRSQDVFGKDQQKRVCICCGMHRQVGRHYCPHLWKKCPFCRRAAQYDELDIEDDSDQDDKDELA